MTPNMALERLTQEIPRFKKNNEIGMIQNKEEKYRILFEKSKDAILIIENKKFIDCNQAAIDMLGYHCKKDLLHTHPSQLSPARQPDGQDSLTKANEMMDLALKNDSHRFEWDHIRSNGDIFPVEVLLTTISDQKDNCIIHTIWRDITERRRSEQERQKEKETLSIILESTPHGITLINRDNQYLYVNPYFTKITGYTLEDIPTREHWFEKAYPEETYRQKVCETWCDDSNDAGQEKIHEFKIRCKNGESKYIEFRSTFLKDRTISVLTDVTQRRKTEKELKDSEEQLKSLNLRLKYEATHDPLTGALNRRAISAILTRELIRAKRRDTRLSIGLCDIDHFKQVNDRYGHQVGDDVLCSFVRMIQATLRPYDMLGRYGGEEFLLVMPDSTMTSQQVIYERLRATIADHKMATRSGPVNITVSIGITSNKGDDTADTMIKKADTALYRAKEQGRNQLAFSD